MKKIIHHLRSQPEKTRIYYLHLFTIIAGVILLCIWAVSFGTNITAPATQASIKSDLQPFAALKDNIVGGYNSLNNNSTN